MTPYRLRWHERGLNYPFTTWDVDGLKACGEAIRERTTKFAEEYWTDSDHIKSFASNVCRDALAEVRGLPRSPSNAETVPNIIVEFPLRLERCGSLWATPTLTIIRLDREERS